MEKLTINNFLVIQKAEIEFKDINLLIGPQANGKSVIARLIYLFKNFLSNTFFDSVKENLSKREVDKLALSDFEKMFPKYAWENQQLFIQYEFNSHYITFKTKKKADGKSSLLIEVSKSLCDFRTKLRKNYETIKNENKAKSIISDYKIYNDALAKTFDEHQLNKINELSLFIPAGRSFFANVNENIFSLLASGTFEFDQILSDFGSRYNNAKKYYNDRHIMRRHEITKDAQSKLKSLINGILKGEYIHENKKDWIKSEIGKVQVSNSSSGQQEALPLLLLLSFWPYVTSKASFIIEEPEAHLFPLAQRDIINLLGFVYNSSFRNHSFLLTTHSPYVLTAINILIMGEKVKLKNSSAIDHNLCIPFERVSAYKINDGFAENILDYESELISAELIDEVSLEFDKDFSNLLDLI